MEQHLLSGLATGGLYGLMALGLVLIFKATDVANFAQGQMGLVSAYLCFTFVNDLHLSVIPAMLLTLVVSALLALIIERICIRPMLGASVFSAVIMTLGLNIALSSIVGIIWGPFLREEPSPFPAEPIRFGELALATDQVAIIIIAVVLAIGLQLFFKYTLIGSYMIAVSQNRKWPLLLGISVKRVFSITWIMAGALGALAGMLLTQATYLNTGVMNNFIFKAFAAATIGGMTSLGGAFVGGLVLGVIENLVGGYISMSFKDAIAFVMLIGILMLRPEGLFGVSQQRRV